MLKKFSWALGEIVWLLLAAFPSGMTFPAATPPVDTDDGQFSRQVVITMDDLPKTMGSESLESATRVTEAILAALREHKAPALGFVIEELHNFWNFLMLAGTVGMAYAAYRIMAREGMFFFKRSTEA